MPEERRIEMRIMAKPESWQKFGNLVHARMLPPDVEEAESEETLRTEVFAEAVDKLWKATFEASKKAAATVEEPEPEPEPEPKQKKKRRR